MLANGMVYLDVTSGLDLGERAARQPMFLHRYGTLLLGQPKLV